MEEKKKKNADSLLETQLRWRLYEGKAHYSKTWEHEMKNACTVSPGFCMFAALCAPCVSYINRVEALHGDMRFYTCCQGGYKYRTFSHPNVLVSLSSLSIVLLLTLVFLLLSPFRYSPLLRKVRRTARARDVLVPGNLLLLSKLCHGDKISLAR